MTYDGLMATKKVKKKKGKSKRPPMAAPPGLKQEVRTPAALGEGVTKGPGITQKIQGVFSRITKRNSLKKISKGLEKTDKEGETREKGREGGKSLGEKELKNDIKQARKKSLKKKEKAPRHKMEHYLERAGVLIEKQFVSKRIFRIAVILNILASLRVISIYVQQYKTGIFGLLYWMFFVWVFLFAGMLFITWLGFYFYLDLRANKRRMMIEQVFPDFLQLASANIRAGMPLDQALWFAVRPRFGILSSEIESVAKDTLSGTDLEVALMKFTDKYDSPTIKRAFTLLTEGMNAGGEIGDLLNKIALNIQEKQILQKEMGADVTAYAMFIGIATLVAAPFLYALSGSLLGVLTAILGAVTASQSGGGGPSGFSLSFGEISLTTSDFNKFAILALTITSLFSGIITATIRKGDFRKGMNSIPFFIAVTLGIYLIASKGFSILFGSMINI